MKKQKPLKIGITFSLKEPGQNNFWVNGIIQNVVMLAKALKSTERKHKVYLLNTSDHTEPNLPFDGKEFPVVSFWKEHTKMDLVIYLATSVPPEITETYKKAKPNGKTVSYKCGNNYVIEMERIIFKEGDKSLIVGNNTSVDEVWEIPQQTYQNEYYYETLYRKPVITVPFVWDPMFLQKEMHAIDHNHKIGSEKFKEPSKYQPGKTKRLSIFEPNMNVVKFCMMPMLMAERAYRYEGVKDKIEFLSLTNAMHLGKNPMFVDLVKRLDIYNDQKVYVEARYPMPYFLSQHTDIVLSHQWENPLNYAYLDAMYMEYPIIHNADFIKDGGYYYPDFDIKTGEDVLIDVINNHDSRIEEYNAKNKPVLERYISTSKNIGQAYDTLIDNLFNKPGANKQLVYNWQTNSYE
jgi:hypothetical protein